MTGLCAAGFTLYFMSVLFIPLTTAIFLYMLVLPGIQKLSLDYHLPDWLAKTCMMLVALLTLVLLGFVLGISIVNFADNFEIYRDKVIGAVTDVINRVPGIEAPWDANGNGKGLPLKDMVKAAKDVSAAVFEQLGNLGLVFLFLFFMLFSIHTHPREGKFDRLCLKIGRFMLIKIALSFVSAFWAGIVFLLVDLDLALTFALLVFILNFIPNIGSMISSVLPLPIAYAQFGLGPSFWVVLSVPIFLEMIIGNVIEPKWMGDRFGIHPISLLCMLIVWGVLWGIAGAFLAVPITVAFFELSKQYDWLEPIKDFFEAKWLSD